MPTLTEGESRIRTKTLIVAAQPRGKPVYEDPHGLPFSRDFLLSGVPMLVHDGIEQKLWRTTEVGLVQPSPNHARAFSLSVDGTESQKGSPLKVLFQDFHGNLYYEVNVKGNRMTNPKTRNRRLLKSEKPSYDVYGLHDAELLDRSTTVSELFRSQGIDTEWTFFAFKPRQFSTPEHKGPINLQDLRKFASQNTIDLYSERPEQTAEEYMKDRDFVVVLRALKTSYRLDDIKDLEPEKVKSVLKDLIRKHNREVDLNSSNKINHIPFEKLAEDDFEGYVLNVLPKKLARNIALMHNLKIKFNYLHPGNISLMGEIVDLDTPEGEMIEETDEKFSIHELCQDLRSFINIGNNDWFAHLAKNLPRFQTDGDSQDMWKMFLFNFMDTYKEVRKLDPNSFEGLAVELIRTLPGKQDLELGSELSNLFEEIFEECRTEFSDPDFLQPLAEIVHMAWKLKSIKNRDEHVRRVNSGLNFISKSLMYQKLEEALAKVLSKKSFALTEKMLEEGLSKADFHQAFSIVISALFTLFENKKITEYVLPFMNDSFMPRDDFFQYWLDEALDEDVEEVSRQPGSHSYMRSIHILNIFSRMNVPAATQSFGII